MPKCRAAKTIAGLPIVWIGIVATYAAALAGEPADIPTPAREQIPIVPVALQASPAQQTVPKNTATAATPPPPRPRGPGPGSAPADAHVFAQLRGPAFGSPVALTARPNEPLAIPALALTGLYILEADVLEDVEPGERERRNREGLIGARGQRHRRAECRAAELSEDVRVGGGGAGARSPRAGGRGRGRRRRILRHRLLRRARLKRDGDDGDLLAGRGGDVGGLARQCSGVRRHDADPDDRQTRDRLRRSALRHTPPVHGPASLRSFSRRCPQS